MKYISPSLEKWSKHGLQGTKQCYKLDSVKLSTPIKWTKVALERKVKILE